MKAQVSAAYEAAAEVCPHVTVSHRATLASRPVWLLLGPVGTGQLLKQGTPHLP